MEKREREQIMSGNRLATGTTTSFNNFLQRDENNSFIYRCSFVHVLSQSDDLVGAFAVNVIQQFSKPVESALLHFDRLMMSEGKYN